MRGGVIFPAVVIALAMVVSPAVAENAPKNQIFSSPESLDSLKKIPSVRVEDRQGHTEVTYPALHLDKKTYKVIEDRWEDGSEFTVLSGNSVVFRLRDASSPYWGYDLGRKLDIYFVDEALPGPGSRSYGDLEYGYLYLNISYGKSELPLQCVFNKSKTGSDELDQALARPIDQDKLNPVPKLISKILSEGKHTRSEDRCVPYVDRSPHE